MCVCVVMCRFRPLHHLSDRAVCITEAPSNAEVSPCSLSKLLYLYQHIRGFSRPDRYKCQG